MNLGERFFEMAHGLVELAHGFLIVFTMVVGKWLAL